MAKKEIKTNKNGNKLIDYFTIDKEALEKIKQLIKEKPESQGIRVGVRTRGCNGLSYIIEYAYLDQNITKFDDVAKMGDVEIYIDPKIAMFLVGSVMVFQENELESGFDFVNPNEKGRCGCGESFNV